MLVGMIKRTLPLLLLIPALFGQVDLSGTWADRITEDNYERSGGPPLGDYQGIPLNDAGRMKADSHDHSEWSLPEFQCRPHPGPYQWRALGAVRISQEVDPVSREVAVYHFEYLRSLERPIYMDGRPHPPEYAPHSWSGFSTGKWQGNMLVITTTHLKGAYLRRNGASFSDNATMMEYLTRHGDYLLITMIVTDPVWLEEPFIQTTHYELDPAHAIDSVSVHRQRRKHFDRGAAFPARGRIRIWARTIFRRKLRAGARSRFIRSIARS